MMTSEFSLETDRAPVVQTLNKAPESVLLVNAAGVVELANESALALFDTAERKLCGTRLASLFDTRGGVRLDLALARVLADEPGNRLEDVHAHMSGEAARSIKLTLARMRHRDGVCVVAVEDEAAAPPRMPRVNDAFFDEEPEKPVPMASPKIIDQTPQTSGLAVAGQMPWQNRARRAAMTERQPIPGAQETAAIVSRVVSTQPMPQEGHAPNGFDQENTNKMDRNTLENRTDSANRKALETSPSETSNRVTWEPAHRDIYAEFESVKDQRERQTDLPLISPAKCLVSAIQRHRAEAVAESLLLVSDIDEDEHPTRIDEDRLTRMFEALVERMIAVSPPYCEARISFQSVGSEGFLATFVDIGRGLGEQELEALLKQPELALGISHTGLVEASDAASALGLGFSVSSAIKGGTTVEITYRG